MPRILVTPFNLARASQPNSWGHLPRFSGDSDFGHLFRSAPTTLFRLDQFKSITRLSKEKCQCTHNSDWFARCFASRAYASGRQLEIDFRRGAYSLTWGNAMTSATEMRRSG